MATKLTAPRPPRMQVEHAAGSDPWSTAIRASRIAGRRAVHSGDHRTLQPAQPMTAHPFQARRPRWPVARPETPKALESGLIDQLREDPEVPPEPVPAIPAQLVPGHRSPVPVAPVDQEVSAVLELAKMRPETSVRLAQHPLEAAERHGVVSGEQDADGKAHAVFERPVQERQVL